jgi:hypothetical protein
MEYMQYIHNKQIFYLIQPVIYSPLINPSKHCTRALSTGDLPTRPKQNLRKRYKTSKHNLQQTKPSSQHGGHQRKRTLAWANDKTLGRRSGGGKAYDVEDKVNVTREPGRKDMNTAW